MADQTFLHLLLPLLVFQIPQIVVAVGGIVAALVNFRRSKSAAIFALIGLALLFFISVIYPVANAAISWNLRHGSATSSSATSLFTLLGGVMTACHLVIYTCLIVAIFIGRPAAAVATRGVPPLPVR